MENRSVYNEDCFDESTLPCENATPVDYGPIEIEVYPDCFVAVSWTERRCIAASGQGEIEDNTLIISNFLIEPLDLGCSSVIDYWNSLDQSSSKDDLLNAINQFEYDASVALEDLRATDWMSDLDPTLYSCKFMIGVFLHVEFYTQACSQTWRYKYTPKGSKLSYYKYTRTSCGEICCRRSSDKCIESEEFEPFMDVELGTYNVSVDQLGDCNTSSDTALPGIGFERVGECNTNCN